MCVCVCGGIVMWDTVIYSMWVILQRKKLRDSLIIQKAIFQLVVVALISHTPTLSVATFIIKTVSWTVKMLIVMCAAIKSNMQSIGLLSVISVSVVTWAIILGVVMLNVFMLLVAVPLKVDSSQLKHLGCQKNAFILVLFNFLPNHFKTVCSENMVKFLGKN
jgi:hypothetical protein